MVPPVSSVSLLLLFFVPFPFQVKGRRTAKSRYLCGTRSAATGWETTSISTCTSAPRRVGTGGWTRPMKSPLTVRHCAFLLSKHRLIIPKGDQNNTQHAFLCHVITAVFSIITVTHQSVPLVYKEILLSGRYSGSHCSASSSSFSL